MADTMIVLYTRLVLLVGVFGVVRNAPGQSGGCIWYGECGKDRSTGKPLNCLYTGPPKPLTDKHALSMLHKMCPDIIQGEQVLTCCDASQVETLIESFSVPWEILNRCPSCLHNFANIYCQMTCAPTQSNFLHVNQSTLKRQITSISYFLTPEFANGMFNSCKDVQLPSTGGRAMGVLCGRSAAECTPQNWLDYLGDKNNGQTPFWIKFHVTDDATRLPDGSVMRPMNSSIIPCTKPVTPGGSPCSCQDCSARHCKPTPSPWLPTFPCTRHQGGSGRSGASVFTSNEVLPEFPETRENKRRTRFGYRNEHVFIQRTGSHKPIVHPLPPPSTKNVLFNPVFDKEFLHQVIKLQFLLSKLNVSYKSSVVSFGDVCQRQSAKSDCVVPSIPQYFQLNGTKLDEVIYDESGFFILADYMDHLLACFHLPFLKDDTTALHMPCVSTIGSVMEPFDLLGCYDGNNYQNATTLVMTFAIKDPRISASAAAWKTGLEKFISKYPNTNMTLSLFEE